MPAKDKIYRFRALLILLVFGISLLPRQVLHNFITNHKHTQYAGHPGQHQLSVETFSCSADDLFLQQTYTTVAVDSFSPISPFFSVKAELLPGCASGNKIRFTSLRGPPAHPAM